MKISEAWEIAFMWKESYLKMCVKRRFKPIWKRIPHIMKDIVKKNYQRRC